MNKKVTTYLTIIAVVIVVIVIAYLLNNSHFNVLDYLIKLHGG
jgi:hypothetical protein